MDWAYSIRHSRVQNSANYIASNGERFAIVASVEEGVSYDLVGSSSAFNSRRNVVASYDAAAQIEWVIEHPGGNQILRTRILHMDGEGNVYAVGRFSGSLDFDPSSQEHSVSTPAGSVFVQKLDPSGNLIWVGFTTVDGEPLRMGVKSNGNIIVVGRSQGSSSALLHDGSSVTVDKGVFLLEFGPNGDALHAFSISTPNSFNDRAGLAIDGDDNVYVGASVDGDMDLDLKAGVISAASKSGQDAVLVKYDADFDHVWHKIFGDVPSSGPDGLDIISSIVAAEDGFIYVAGAFTWTTDFDPDDHPGTWVLTAATGSQSPDGFLIKYSVDGEIQWIQEAGGHSSIATNADIIIKDMVSSNGQLVVFGEINGSADFDGGSGDYILQTQDNGLGLFLAQYSTAGTFGGAWLIDGNLANESATGIETLGNGVVVYGIFQKELDADITAGQHLLSTDPAGPFYSADNDIFVAKYSLGTSTHLVPEFKDVETSIVAYPNPAHGLLTITNIRQGSRLKIFDMTGRKVHEVMSYNEHSSIDVSSLPDGVYFIQSEYRGVYSGKSFIVVN